MNRDQFEDRIADWITEQRIRNAASAHAALVGLYDLLQAHALRAERQSHSDPEGIGWSLLAFKIEQIIEWTPLRLFADVLAEDDAMWVSAAAKFFRFHTSGGSRPSGLEHRLMESAYDRAMASALASGALMEMAFDPAMTKAAFLWQLSGAVTPFQTKVGFYSIAPGA